MMSPCTLQSGLSGSRAPTLTYWSVELHLRFDHSFYGLPAKLSMHCCRERLNSALDNKACLVVFYQCVSVCWTVRLFVIPSGFGKGGVVIGVYYNPPL